MDIKKEIGISDATSSASNFIVVDSNLYSNKNIKLNSGDPLGSDESEIEENEESFESLKDDYKESRKSIQSQTAKLTQSGKTYYIQKYTSKWEKYPKLSGWLMESPRTKGVSYCKVCEVDLAGSRTVLERHADTRKHQKKARMDNVDVYNVPNKSDFDDDTVVTSVRKKSPAKNEPTPIIKMKTPLSPQVKRSINVDRVPSNHILQSGFFNKTLRQWQSDGTEIHPWNLMYPIFVTDEDDTTMPVYGLTEVFIYGVDKIIDMLTPLIYNGLSAIFLIGVPSFKDTDGSLMFTDQNPAVKAIEKVKSAFPHVTVAADVCLCTYIDHGNCAVLNSSGTIAMSESIEVIVKQSLLYANAGVDIVAPSSTIDGHIRAIKEALKQSGFANKVSVISSSAKFLTCFNEMAQNATGANPSGETKKCLHLPSGSAGLAYRAVERDTKEGADIILVEPCQTYLDIVYSIKEKFPHHPLFAFQVSGEYAMLHKCSEDGILDLRKTLMETLTAIRRAGAEVIISYFAPKILQWLKDKDVIIIRF